MVQMTRLYKIHPKWEKQQHINKTEFTDVFTDEIL